MFQATTHNIKVEVIPSYVESESDPRQGRYFFSYKVRITNEGPRRWQLLSRHWVITDGFGEVEEVRGSGVVGLQPTIEPGQSFEYSSFCPLTTPTGSMHGSYLLQDPLGKQMEVEIPKFVLSEPSHFH